MAITIIGESSATNETLPFPEHDLPAPESVGTLKPIWQIEALEGLLGHSHPMVRAFAIKRIAAIGNDDAIATLITKISDETVSVARSAIESLGDLKAESAIEALGEIFSDSKGEVAADAAVALGRIKPEALVELVKTRGRLDDYAYAITTMQLARTEEETARAYLAKGMDRAGALSQGRRIALYTAALMSGEAQLVKRVLGTAILESKEAQDSEQASSAARLSVGAAAGLPATMSPISAGATLLQSITPENEDKIQDDAQQAFVAALRMKKVDEAIQALAPLAVHGVSEYASPELQSAGRRCRVLLDEIIGQSEGLSKLTSEAAAIFAAAALDAAAIVHSSQNDPSEAPALIALGKALEVTSIDFLEMDAADLQELFRAKTPREVRQISSILSANPIEEDLVTDKLVHAFAKAGHETAILEAAAEAKTDHLGRAVLRVFTKEKELGETAALEALSRRPLEPHTATLALVIAAELATERLSLAVGRRFLDLREIDRMRFANAIIKMGDVRLAPLAKARAYRDEPEEAAWVLLSLLDQQALEGELAEADQRVKSRPSPEQDYRIVLPLKCEHCGETLTYRFFSVFVDPQATESHGDPAYVGDTRCKACGTEDKLSPTDIAVRIMTENMMSFLVDLEQGRQSETPPKVVPRRTRYNGKEMSVAAAARAADKDVLASPESIRAHLRRARIRLLLRRYTAKVDAERALEIDPSSAEAKYVYAGALAQQGELDQAVEALVEARDTLLTEESPRLYEETKEVLLSEADGSLLQLEKLGAKIPEELDLSKARSEEEARIESLRQRQAELSATPDPSATPPEHRLVSAEEMQKTKRNDPCPCGSGKKFKKCHGK